MRLPAVILAAPAIFTLGASLSLVYAWQWKTGTQLAHGSEQAWVWWVYALDWNVYSSRAAKLWVAGTGIVGAILAALVVRATLAGQRSKLYGEAKWQTINGAMRSGIKFSLKPPPDAILLGKRSFGPVSLYASLPGDTHISLTAQTGAGKGVSFVVPNALNWGGPLFCFSVKRDVLEAAAAERERMGDKVFVFDVTEPEGATHRWSGFGEARRFSVDVYDDIQRIFWTILPETKANNPYWDNAARKIATAVGVMLAETPGQVVSVAEVLRVIEAPDYESRLKDMIYLARAELRPFPASAVDVVLSWLDSKAEEGAASVRENILTGLALWHVPRVAAATGGQDFNLGNIRSQRISIFVCAQPGDIRRLRPIYSLLFTQFMWMNSRQDWDGHKPGSRFRSIRTLVLLDEMWALGEMKELADALAFLRSFGLRFAVVLQTKDQIKKSFGEEGARNLFNNTQVELIFGGCDDETAAEVSKRAGTDTVEESSTSKPKFGFWRMDKTNENLSKKARPLILPQEVAALPSDVVVVQMKGKPPLKLKRIFWYSDNAFYGKAGALPPMPKLEIEVARDSTKLEISG